VRKCSRMEGRGGSPALGLDTEIFNAGDNQSGEGGWGSDAKEGAQHLWGKEGGRSRGAIQANDCVAVGRKSGAAAAAAAQRKIGGPQQSIFLKLIFCGISQ
jgi:hypothetical protein